MMMPGSLRILVCRESVDFRRSFNGLCGFVRDVLGEDPRSATLFVFRNNRCNQMKILWWDGNGYAIWMKRLCEGTFSKLSSGEIDATTLAGFLEEIKRVQLRK